MNIPEKCFSLNNMTVNPQTKVGDVIEIRALETGYYRTTQKATQEEVNAMNEKLGVTIPQARAMEIASMFGWDVYKDNLQSYEKIKALEDGTE